MYSTCIFCHSALGANEAIEHFPVGRRLAFDAAKGRLWAVCRSCERWNLSPIDERWEAIEECEKLFRDSKLRVSTENIGLARLRDGTTLVRVGDPQRPEMAAWRYGDRFHRRRRKHIAFAAGGAVVGLLAVDAFVTAIPPEWFAGGFLIGGAGPLLMGFMPGVLYNRTRARVPLRGAVLKLSRSMVRGVTLHSNEAQGFALEVPHKPLVWPGETEVRGANVVISGVISFVDQPRVMLHGDEALRAARHLLPRINRAGAPPAHVADAVEMLESVRSAEHLFGHTAFMHRSGVLAGLPAPLRLALEMSLHEDDERRALEGELALLEDRWREAEEVAAISDDMFLPSVVTAALQKLKNRR
jgi:hypothetical protein